MRDPAIHIKRSDLVKVFMGMALDVSAARINDIMREAMKYSIRNRVNVILPANSRKKAERVIDTESEWVDTFNGVYSAVMLENNIKVLPIHKKDPQYLTLKEITRQAIDFCTLYQLPYEAGFKEYIQLGVTLLNKKYSLYRLKASADWIASTHRDIITIADDPTPELTKKLHTCWLAAMKKYAGVVSDIPLASDKYVHLVYTKQDAEELKADYDDWMNAQFEKWSYLKSVPEFSQLHGENAKLNYKIYAGKETQNDAGYDKAIKSGKEIPYKEVKFRPRTPQG